MLKVISIFLSEETNATESVAFAHFILTEPLDYAEGPTQTSRHQTDFIHKKIRELVFI